MLPPWLLLIFTTEFKLTIQTKAKSLRDGVGKLDDVFLKILFRKSLRKDPLDPDSFTATKRVGIANSNNVSNVEWHIRVTCWGALNGGHVLL